MIITFCGHAQFSKTKEYEQKILAILEEKIGSQPAEIYLGGYGQFDAFALACCKKYKNIHPNISLVFVTPYLTIGQKAMYDSILYPEIEDKPLKYAIIHRNRYMVEKADYIIAYVCRTSGGAYTTYQYAKRKGKEIFNLTDLK